MKAGGRVNQKPVWVVAALIRRDFDPQKRILLVRRGPEQSGAGFWEFPGGKVEQNEKPENALAREIDEELGLAIEVEEFLEEMDFSYATKTIRLRVYWARTSQNHLELREHDAMKWCLPEEIVEQELSEADRPFVNLILNQGKR